MIARRAVNLLYAPALCLALSACSGTGLIGASAAETMSCTAGKDLGFSDAGLSRAELCIKSARSSHIFIAEVAATSREQATGLMFRKSLADNAAMIFPLTPPREASFWMKNTLIPLDIIFIRSDGTIESIAENTVPYSEDPVSSGETVAAVLELRGGLTRETGIKAGDIVRWK